MKNLMTAFFILLSISSFAATKDEVRKEIRILSNKLNSQFATEGQLEEVLNHLQEAKNILIEGDDSTDVDFQVCLDYAFLQYSRTLSSSAAMDKAVSACKKVHDLDILKYSFEQAARSASSNNSMDLVAELNTIKIVGKLEMVQFSFEQYSRSLSSYSSIGKALTQSALANRKALDCIKKVFPEYNRSLSSTSAMDKSFEACK